MMEGYISADLIDRYELVMFEYDRGEHSGVMHLVDKQNELPPIYAKVRDYSHFLTSPEPIIWAKCSDSGSWLSVQFTNKLEKRIEKLFYGILKYIDRKVYDTRRTQCTQLIG